MKKEQIRLFLSIAFIGITVFISSCSMPSPLYGSWADNRGNKLTFMNDGNFTATIKEYIGTRVHQGSYTVIENVISFSLNDGRKIVSEWDIGGTVLRMDWPSQSGNINITLYKIAN